MDMIQRDNKMEFGYWMISPDSNGGYAYAKIRSNGTCISIYYDSYL